MKNTTAARIKAPFYAKTGNTRHRKLGGKGVADMEKLAAELVDALEKSGVRDLALYLHNPRRLIVWSFVSGVFRGLGSAIGFSVLGAIVLLILGRIFGMDFTK